MPQSLCLGPLNSLPKQTQPRFQFFKPVKPIQVSARARLTNLRIYSGLNYGRDENFEHQAAAVSPDKPRWENFLATAASLYPLYVTVGGVVAILRPSTFASFVELAPTSYSLTLGFIMLAMGITLELKELISLFRQRPISQVIGTIAFSFSGFDTACLLPRRNCFQCALQVTLIAGGDVPLSIVMTVCTTLGAVILTPLLCKILAGTYISVDVVSLSVSTLQVVVAPILLGSYLQSTYPEAVNLLIPFAPLVAVLSSSLLACSVFSENVVRLKSSISGLCLSSDLSPILRLQALFSSELGAIVLSVLLLHLNGFFVGYMSAAFGGFKEPQRRAISIEVGMQNSSLGVVLATSHFVSPAVALPSAISAVIMNIMGSSLGFFWRHVDRSDPEDQLKIADK